MEWFVGRGVFEAWQELGAFEQVAITPVGALEWPSEIDFCPRRVVSPNDQQAA